MTGRGPAEPPRTLGGILDRGASSLRQVGLTVAPWFAVVVGPYLLLTSVALYLVGGEAEVILAGSADIDPWSVLAVGAATTIGLPMLQVVALCLVGAPVIDAVDRHANGESVSSQSVLRFGWARAGVALQVAAGFLGLWGAPCLVIGAVMAVWVGWWPDPDASSVQRGVDFVLSLLVLGLVSLVVAVVVAGRFALALGIAVLEDVGVRAAFRQSAKRSKGWWWTSLGLVGVMVGLTIAGQAGLGSLVPTPDLVDLQPAEIAALAPELKRAQIYRQVVGALVASGVGTYGLACLAWLHRATAPVKAAE